jgi:hypothetical protein
MTKTKNISLAPVIQECERIAAECIKHFGMKTRPESLVFTIQSKGKKNALGWFWANRWQNGSKESVQEINLSAETLRECNPGEVLIHELAHAENHTLGIKDCNNNVHNKKFKSMAERLGLEVKPRDKRYGFGFTDLGPEAKKFLESVKFNRDIFTMNRLLPLKKQVAGTRLLKVECPECGYVCRVTQKWIDVGLPACPCGEQMEAAS